MIALYWVVNVTLERSEKEDRTAWVKIGDDNDENLPYISVISF